MKKILSTILVATIAFYSQAQVLYNNGASLTIRSGCNVYANGNVVNAAGSIANNGLLNIKGNITNNATITAPTGSTLQLNGTTAQTLSGTSVINAKNVTVNNAAGITLGTALRVDAAITFTSGNITAPTTAAALVFTSNGTVAGTPTDASHVNGFVVKEGTGSFDYPVGTATKYQKTTVNLTANAGGMAVKYFAANAGTGTFTTGGTEAVPLASYNTNEYWDIAPLTTATGTVTMFWDGSNDTYSNPVAQRRVAHKVGGNWLNEGTIGTGTTAAGSVTSNSLSSWSPFAMGSVVSVLPVKWLSVTGSISNNGNATINWKVEEQNAANYEVQKSIDGRSFQSIGITASKGNGQNEYSFTDATALQSVGYYRIHQIDVDGRSSLSAIVKLSAKGEKAVSVYPVPAQATVVVSVPQRLLATNAVLLNNTGQQIKTLLVTNTNFTIDVSNLVSGVYILRFANGSSAKLVKE